MANCVNGAAMRSIDRRGVLRGLAGSALAGPLAQIFRMHTGRAAGAAALPKVVFFYTPCGVQLPMWHPTQTGTTFTLPRLSAPLQPYQSQCIFMDGVCMAPLTEHEGGSQQMLVGDDKDVATLDLRLGDYLMGSTNLPFPSLQLGVQSRISKGERPLSRIRTLPVGRLRWRSSRKTIRWRPSRRSL